MTATVLIIDDSEDDQRLYQLALRECDCILEQALTAEAGLARISDKKPDLILLDCNLPHADGLNVLQRLAGAATDIPVVMLTGARPTADAVEAMRQNATDYLIKDTEGLYLRLLPDVLRRALTAHAQHRQIRLLRLETERLRRRNQALMQNSMDSIYVMDMQGNVVDANHAFYQMLGYTPEEVTRLNVTDRNTQWSKEALLERFERITGKSAHFETVYRRKDGSLIHVEVSASAMEIDGQQLIFAASHDITPRKQKEEILLRSEKMFSRVFHDSLDAILISEAVSGRILNANKSFLDLFGHLAEEVLGRTSLEIGMWDSNAARNEVISIIKSKGFLRNYELKNRTKDGRVLTLLTSSSPIHLNENSYLVTHFMDITERKKAEDELRIAAVTFETHDAIVITDVNANIVRVNQAFTDVTGYTQDEVLGKNPRIMNSGRQERTFYIEMWQQLLHTGSWAGEIWDKRKNGQIYPKWMTITAVRNERRETTHYVAIFSDITARKQAEEEIRNLAFYDALTRLPNRRLFLDRFRAAQTTSARRKDHGAVLFIDMDRFKILNDTLGHDFGDMLLIEVADRIKACVREMDTVARLGGDEFVVLIEGVSHDEDEAPRHVGIVAEKIREALARPYLLKTHKHHSSPSIGISMYSGHRATVDEVLQQADLAMYQAKNAGRNTVRFFDPVMQINVATRAELENDLHHALAYNQLCLHYQVQVGSDHRPTGAEALLRWFHPQRGVVMPNQFIQIAEESALILDIGHWVLDEACRRIALWAQNARTGKLTLAVNVSAKQFAQPNFVEQVARCLASHGAAPSRLKLELTEGLVLEDMKGAISKMNALKKLGVRLSIDDFGTGYSSLSYLKLLPLDQIKIDQSFIHGITGDGNDALLVKTIIDLARNFNMNVIAEGVETAAQLAFLKHHDCTAYQGFLFGKPAPIEEFEKLLDTA
jgi:diguanylate cyclase (GGDEF)-like protein/PAS domain S-box-containing protein